MSHYFIDDPSLCNEIHSISFTVQGKTFDMFSTSGVFSKKSLDFGSELLINQIINQAELRGKVLDMGSGIGVIGFTLAYFYPDLEFTLVDVNSRAIKIANLNKDKLNLQNTTIILSDLYQDVRDKFDIIISNPPIRTGKKIVYQLFEESFVHLNDSGILYLVIRKEQGALSAIDKLATIFPKVNVVIRKKGYYIIKCQK